MVNVQIHGRWKEYIHELYNESDTGEEAFIEHEEKIENEL